MSSVFEEEEEELDAREDGHDGDERRDREVTLNSMTLLGIFFALVLICGLCFGVGFSLGRRGASASASDVAAPTKTEKAGVLAEPVEYHAKPSASAQGSAVVPTVPHETAEREPIDTAAKDEPAEGRESAKAPKVQDVAVREPQSPKAPVKAAVVPAAASAPGTYMVQIAAGIEPCRC